MAQAYKVVIERDTQGEYTATFPGFLDCKAQARSLKTLMERIREVTSLCPEAGDPTPTRQTKTANRESKY
jgi:predicted RNase H-like HicB family nuclease